VDFVGAAFQLLREAFFCQRGQQAQMARQSTLLMRICKHWWFNHIWCRFVVLIHARLPGTPKRGGIWFCRSFCFSCEAFFWLPKNQPSLMNWTMLVQSHLLWFFVLNPPRLPVTPKREFNVFLLAILNISNLLFVRVNKCSSFAPGFLMLKLGGFCRTSERRGPPVLKVLQFWWYCAGH